MAISSVPHSVSGGTTSRAGSIIRSLTQTAPKWAAVATGPEILVACSETSEFDYEVRVGHQ